jgi:hypothetical protein
VLGSADLALLFLILGMLGSNHPGERASAALAGHRQVKAMGTAWSDLFRSRRAPRSGDVILRTFYENRIDHVRAAEARMRQLRSKIEGWPKENTKLKTRLAVRADQERRARMHASDP